MTKTLITGFALSIITLFVVSSVALGQTTTPTETPSPTTSPTATPTPTGAVQGASTTIPSGAPNTGFGGY